jgi:hypothetical protein
MLTGEQLRDTGIALVSENNKDWNDEARRLLKVILWTGQHVTGEDIKTRVLGCGMTSPKHPNAWGSLVNWAVNNGILEDTGRAKKCILPSAHARRTAIWRVK